MHVMRARGFRCSSQDERTNILQRMECHGSHEAGLISGLIFTVLLHSGCSYLFVSGPPTNHAQMGSFECSESNAWPVIDAIWAGLNGIGAASAASDDQNPNQGQVVAVGLAWLAVSGISAIYGFTKVSDCHAAKRLRDERYYPERIAVPAPTPVPVSAAPGAWGAVPPPRTVVPAAPVVPPAPGAPAPAPVPAAAPVPATPAAAPVP